MKVMALVLLALSLIIGGLILQINIADLNTTAWNFTGASFLSALTEWLGALLMIIGCGVLVIIGYGEKGS